MKTIALLRMQAYFLKLVVNTHYWLCAFVNLFRKGVKTMKPRPDIFGDLATMAHGAASALGSLREEFDTIKKGRQERGQNAAGIVTREEFDALMTRLEALAQRIAFLEAAQQAPQAKPKPAAKRQAKAKKDS